MATNDYSENEKQDKKSEEIQLFLSLHQALFIFTDFIN